MFEEDELLPVSALQHFMFCPRRCALVHIEQVWMENQFTVEGDILHERVDEVGRESRATLVPSDVEVHCISDLVRAADMLEEDELLPVSALQHFMFCPR